ncbi:hypothetical protein N7497_005972 [Penicillium chrysogenum]|nr:hypothetical protein N7497_005972 [Penicillium chrysogenum]
MRPADELNQPKFVLTLPREKTQDEIEIEQSGDIDALQRYRWNVVHQNKYHYANRAVELLRVEQELRSTVQEEQILAEKPETTRSWSIYNDTQSKLQALDKRYWLLERQWWKVRNSFVEGPLIRGFDLWRSHPLCLVAALDPSGVRLFLWDVFLFFFAVVAILRLDYFFKRVIDRGFPPPTPPTPPPELPVRRRPPMTAEDHARILAKYRANHPPATPQQGDE